ncbi:MAG: carboxypeptidase regulatory-like domain-containing protein, partial [Candidatus Cloacimonetes bacterium]|nr:carboxypeptidase regulatory-like domain-containing protein [Candidatus Cloacimonadota bacterium]
GTWTETSILIASDGEAEDFFGTSMSISDDYAIIGACYDDENGENSGSAYIFHNNGGTWEQYQKITASDGQTNDFFAITVTISGDYAFVNSLCGINYAGKVYVFYNDAGTWSEISILIASDGEAYDFFGTSMSISDDYAIIGAYGNDDSGSESGSAYVFYNNEGTWTETTKLTAFDGNENDRFGISVGISDDYAIIGADGSANNNGTNSGTAYIFYNNLENWEQTQQIESLDAVLGDQFGQAVSISGEYAAIGAEYKSDNGTWSGAAYVFHDNSGIWEQDIKLTASDAGEQKHFGNSIDISSDKLIVGSNGNIAFTPYIAGSAYMFKNILGSWQEIAILEASDIANEDQFAYVVDLSDDFAFVGSPRTDTNYEDAGAVYVYELIPTTGYIAGTVTDNEGNLLENAEITAGTYNTQTGINGEYEVEVEAGDYTVSCYLEGYVIPENVQVIVVATETVTADFVLAAVVNADNYLLAKGLTLLDNHPNPFNPSTTIKFSIHNDSKVELIIYNIKGQKIKTLAQDEYTKGSHSIIWNGIDELNEPVSSGVYFYKLKVNGKTEGVKKMLLLK